MDILKWLARYGLVLVAFTLIDMVWLIFVARSFYQKYLGFLMRDPVNWGAAGLFYLLFIVGILFFAVAPALEKNSLGYAALAGALFGLMTYATYDLTNLATLKNWPLIVTLVDLAWGTTVCTLTSMLGYTVIRKWVP